MSYPTGWRARIAVFLTGTETRYTYIFWCIISEQRYAIVIDFSINNEYEDKKSKSQRLSHRLNTRRFFLFYAEHLLIHIYFLPHEEVLIPDGISLFLSLSMTVCFEW